MDHPLCQYVIHIVADIRVEDQRHRLGRAGRDGAISECILLYSNGDKQKHYFFLRDKNADLQVRIKQELDELVDFAEATGCRRKRLLAYFGEVYPSDNCGSCDNCLSSAGSAGFDGLTIARLLLTCIDQTKERLTEARVIDVLLGNTKEASHCKALPSFGVGRGYARDEWRHFLQELRQQGLIRIDHKRYGEIKITGKGEQAIQGRLAVRLSRPKHAIAQQVAIAHVGADSSPLETLRLLKEGMTATQVAEARTLAFSTIMKHVAWLNANGYNIGVLDGEIRLA